MPTSWLVIYFTAVRCVPLAVRIPELTNPVGYCLRHSVEQQGSLQFLSRVEKVLGWRTCWIRQDLERQWAELAEMES